MADSPSDRAPKRQRTGSLVEKSPTSSTPPSISANPDTSSPLIVLAPTGDVIFLLNNGVRLRILTDILRLSSPVFRAMFSEHFSENRNFSATVPKEIQLLDDDPNRMYLVLSLLHYGYKYDNLPGVEALHKFVQLVHKYDCLNAVQSTAQMWLNRHVSKAQESHCYLILLSTAALLDEKTSFYNISKKIMVCSQQSLCSFEGSLILPNATLIALAERIARTKTKLIIRMSEAFNELTKTPTVIHPDNNQEKPCECKKNLSSRLYKRMRTLLTAGKSLQCLIDMFEPQSFNYMWEQSSRGDNSTCQSCKASPGIRNSLRGKLEEEAMKTVYELEGLCFDCLNNNGQPSAAHPCVIKHKQPLY